MVEEKEVAPLEMRAVSNYAKFMKKRSKLDRFPSGVKNLAFRMAGKKVWGPRRAPLIFAKQSFAKQRMGNNN